MDVTARAASHRTTPDHRITEGTEVSPDERERVDDDIHSRPSRRADRSVQRAVAATLTALLSLTLVPVTGTAPAAAINDVCADLYDIVSEVDPADLPGGDLDDVLDERISSYEYENPAEPLRSIQEPSAEFLEDYDTNYQRYQSGTEDHFYRRWKAYLVERQAAIDAWEEGGQQGPRPAVRPWSHWRNNYIPNQANDARGKAYERVTARRLGLGGRNWICQDENLTQGRRYDAVNRDARIIYEFKSSSRIDPVQLENDRRMRQQGWSVRYVFGRKPSATTVRMLRDAGIGHSVMRSTGIQTNRSRPGGTSLTPNPQRPSGGPVHQIAGQSGRNAADAREANRVQAGFERETRRVGEGPRRPGGIDWTTLELRYVSEDPGEDRIDYAFSADDLPDDGEENPGWGGEAALDLSSDALFTWLALDPSSFWVNLNPDTPDTVIDETLATTDAGRVLLEADLALKRANTELMNPASTTGAEFWESLERGPDGTPCFDSYRIWIEPQPASVRANGDELYILDAPLRVEVERMDISTPGPGGPGCTAPEEVLQANYELQQELVRPALEDVVNTAPQFADLRRVYTARVAAEWIRQRDARRPGAFHDVIGTGDVSRWPARTEWDPQAVFDEYVEDFQTIQYRYEWEDEGGTFWVEVGGGVDFARAPRDDVGAARFAEEHPALPEAVRDSTADAVSYADTDSSWLGGGTFEEAQEPPGEPTDPPDPPGGGSDDPPGGGSDDPPGGGGDDEGPGGAAPVDNDLPWQPEQGGPAQELYDPPVGALPQTGYAGMGLVPTALGLILAGLGLLWTGSRLRLRRDE